MIKAIIHQKDLTIADIYALNVSAPKLIKQTLLDIKAQTNTNTITVGNFNTPLSQ
jgi:hypothetical protein